MIKQQACSAVKLSHQAYLTISLMNLLKIALVAKHLRLISTG